MDYPDTELMTLQSQGNLYKHAFDCLQYSCQCAVSEGEGTYYSTE